MNSSPSPKSNDSDLDRERFLTALDSAIAHVESTRASRGLSQWGLIVSLSALLWLGLQILDQPSYKLQNVAVLVVTFTILWDFIAKVMGALDAPLVPNQRVRGGFIGLTQMIGAFRSIILFNGLKQGLLLTAVLVSHHPGFFLIKLYLLFGLLGSGLSLVITYLTVLPIPVMEQRSTGRTLAIVYQWCGWLVRIFVAVSLVLAMVKLRSDLSTNDLRLGIVVAASLYLLSLLVHDRFATNHLVGLRKVRQNLAFDFITLNEAREQADLLLTFGGNSTATVHREPEAILDSADIIRTQFREVERLHKQLSEPASVGDQLTLDYKVQQEERKRDSKLMPELYTEACVEHDKLLERVRRFEAYAQFLPYISASGATQVQPLADKLRHAIEPLATERDRIHRMLN